MAVSEPARTRLLALGVRRPLLRAGDSDVPQDFSEAISDDCVAA